MTYVACCEKFFDFQINLFVKTDSFPLRIVDYEQNYFTSSVCYSKMRKNLIFGRFCSLFRIVLFSRKKMPNPIKVCDYFFDVGVYCKKNNLFYSKFFNRCLKERTEKRTYFMITTHDK